MPLEETDFACTGHPKPGAGKSCPRTVLAVDDQRLPFFQRKLLASRQHRVEGNMHGTRNMGLGEFAA